MTEQKILVTRKEAAELLSVSVRSIDYLIAGRELPSQRIGRRVLVSRRALEKFAMRNHPVPIGERGER